MTDSWVGKWLPFLDTYRAMCLAQQPEFRGVLEEIQEFFSHRLDLHRQLVLGSVSV